MIVNKDNSQNNISSNKKQQSTIIAKNKAKNLQKGTNKAGKMNKKKFIGGMTARQNNSMINQSLKQNNDSIIKKDELKENNASNELNNDVANNEGNKEENKNNEFLENNINTEEIIKNNEKNENNEFIAKDKAVLDNEDKNHEIGNYEAENTKNKKIAKIKLAINPKTTKKANVSNSTKNYYYKTTGNKKKEDSARKRITQSFDKRSRPGIKFNKINSNIQIKYNEPTNLCKTQRGKPNKIFNNQNYQRNNLKRDNAQNIIHKKNKSIASDSHNEKKYLNRTLNENNHNAKRNSLKNNENVPFDLISLFSKNEKDLIDKIKLICERNKLKFHINLSNKYTINYMPNNLSVEFDVANKGENCFLLNIKKVNGSDKMYIKEMNKLMYRMNIDK